MSFIDMFSAATAMLLVFVLSQFLLQHAVLEGAGVGCSCKTVCTACLCVHPACIVLMPTQCKRDDYLWCNV